MDRHGQARTNPGSKQPYPCLPRSRFADLGTRHPKGFIEAGCGLPPHVLPFSSSNSFPRVDRPSFGRSSFRRQTPTGLASLPSQPSSTSGWGKSSEKLVLRSPEGTNRHAPPPKHPPTPPISWAGTGQARLDCSRRCVHHQEAAGALG